MKKLNYLYFLFFTLIIASCSISSKVKENKTLLKEYAFCKCIEYTSTDSLFFKKDLSLSIYKEVAQYYPEAYEMIDSVVAIESQKIKPSVIADHQNQKAIFKDCFLIFKSKKLDSLVNALKERSY